MGFKLTYRDGEADEYDDQTKWDLDCGVLRMGREPGKWTVLVSPSHWATIEVRSDEDNGGSEDGSGEKGGSENGRHRADRGDDGDQDDSTAKAGDKDDETDDERS